MPPPTTNIVLGGHVRVGFEDTLYLRAGELAEGNAQPVERTREIAGLLGRPVAIPEEARGILGIE